MDRIKQAKEKLLQDRASTFGAAQELGQRYTEAKQECEAAQRRLSELEMQYRVLQGSLRELDAQIRFCESFSLEA